MSKHTQTVEPVRPQNRAASLDILRGIALLGIALVNVLGFNASFFDFGGFYSALPDVFQKAVFQLIISLFADKFIFIFSFLFGYGIYMQYRRFSLQQLNFVPFFSRRMGVLLMFGVLHVGLLWAGDILILYAIAGMVVLAIRKWSPVLLLTTGLFFYFFISFWLVLSVYIPLPDGLSSACPTCLREALEVYATGHYFEILQLRATEYQAFLPVNLIYYFPKVIGVIIFGFLASRYSLHTQIQLNKKRWVLVTLLVAGVSAIVFTKYESVIALTISDKSSFLPAASMFGYELMNLFVASAYILVVLMLCAYRYLLKMLHWFSYAGRMSLTNYLGQSLIFAFFFYGWGLGFFGWEKPLQLISVALFVFILQVIFSYLWLKEFQQGPLEMLWRRLSYRGEQKN